MLEQVTRELNIEALPTDIPEHITVDVSGLEIAATHAPLARSRAPEGVEFLDDPEETIIATIIVPTEVEEPERSRRRPSWSARRARPPRARRPRRRPRAPPPTRRAGDGGRGVLSLFRRRRRWRGGGQGRLADRRARQPGRPLRPHAPQRRLRGGERARRSAGGCRSAKKKYAGLYTDGRTGPGGPRVGVLLPQTYMNDAGRSAGPARGALGVRPRPRRGGPRRDRPAVRRRRGPPRRRARGPQRAEVAEAASWASPDFHRVRRGRGAAGLHGSGDRLGRVLGRFSEPQDEVRALVERPPTRSSA